MIVQGNRVDTSQEQRESFDGIIEQEFKNGNLVAVRKIPAVTSAPTDTANTKANGGKR